MKKSKVYELIGRATIALSVFAIAEIGFIKTMIYILDNCLTTVN